jgi:hypothetical protein
MTHLARHFNGTLNLSDHQVQVSVSTLGDKDAPDLIVTTVRSEIGFIMKPALNGDDWWNIAKTSKELSPESRRQLEKDINDLIRKNGAPVDCSLGICELQ